MSQLQKHERMVLAAVQALADDVTATLDKGSGNGHPVMRVVCRGATLRLPISCTPRDKHAVVIHIVQQVRRYMLQRGVRL